MTHSTHSISPLRQRMIDDMTLRKLAPKTQAAYLRAVVKFTRFFGQSPDLASPPDASSPVRWTTPDISREPVIPMCVAPCTSRPTPL